MKTFYFLLLLASISACSFDLGDDWSIGVTVPDGKAYGKVKMDIDSVLHVFEHGILNLPSDPSNYFSLKVELLRGSLEILCFNQKSESTSVDIDLTTEEFTYATFIYEDKLYQAGLLTTGARGSGMIHIDEITDHSAKGSFNIDVVSETGEVIHITNGSFDLSKE